MKKLKISGLLTMVFLLIILISSIGCTWFAKPEVKEEIIPVEKKVGEKATLVINDGTRNPQNFELEVKENTTAFDLLKQATNQAQLELDYSESDFGVMVNAIGDKKNGQEEKYWLFYVNGEMPQIAANKQKVKVGDKVEFKFEKSQF